MRRYSPGYYSPPRRGYGGRGRSPPRGGYSPPRRGYSPPRRSYGGYGRRKEQNHGSLLVRNIPLDCRPEELRVPFERFGLVRDVYIPKDYYTGDPRGFAFVQFVDPYEASEAQYHMNGQIFAGREITVVVATESRKRPEDMRQKYKLSDPRHGGRRSPYHRRSRSRSISRSPSPPPRRHHSGSRGVHHSRSYSPSPKRRDDYSVSPRRAVDPSRSPRDLPRDKDGRKSYSPNFDDQNENANEQKKSRYVEDEGTQTLRDSPRRSARSPSGSRSRSRSRSADISPEQSR